MTEKELGQMHYLNREIEKLNEELSWMECKSKIKSPLLTGMPFGTEVSDKTADYAVRMEEIRELIDLSLKKLLHTRAESDFSVFYFFLRIYAGRKLAHNVRRQNDIIILEKKGRRSQPIILVFPPFSL